jgi:excisionase family DNA binding protein
MTETTANRWFSVKEAAEYLGVSEPTIYRWMKNHTLSFFKVGGSTRFDQEGLDAVIAKSTGKREAEVSAGKCAACGHEILIEGRMQGTGRLYFRPQKTKFWTFSEGIVPTVAKVCAACGYIQMHADTSKLERLMPEGQESS